MEVIQSLIDSRNYNELVNVCEQMELEVGPLLSLVLNTFADISVYWGCNWSGAARNARCVLFIADIVLADKRPVSSLWPIFVLYWLS